MKIEDDRLATLFHGSFLPHSGMPELCVALSSLVPGCVADGHMASSTIYVR